MIEFICCGETNYVKSIDDCNLVGDFKIILNILNKCLVYKDHMEDHVYKPGKSKTNDDTWYTVYPEIFPMLSRIGGSKSNEDKEYCLDRNFHWNLNHTAQYNILYTQYLKSYGIINSMPKLKGPGGKFTDKDCTHCIYGSKADLENWKYFVFNNKLPLFINICLIISQNNTVKPYIPFIVDKQYTDEEIYNTLNINKEEQKFIDNTIKKYERNSPWFKRYMCGKNTDK